MNSIDRAAACANRTPAPPTSGSTGPPLAANRRLGKRSRLRHEGLGQRASLCPRRRVSYRPWHAAAGVTLPTGSGVGLILLCFADRSDERCSRSRSLGARSARVRSLTETFRTAADHGRVRGTRRTRTRCQTALVRGPDTTTSALSTTPIRGQASAIRGSPTRTERSR